MPDDDVAPPEPIADPAAASAAAAAALRRATASTAPAIAPRRRVAGASYSDGRDPALVGDALERLVRDLGWTDRAAVARLMSAWPAAVGAELAEHVTPAAFADGELTVQADSTAWATQVRLLLPALHRAVDQAVGPGVVTRISVVGPQAPSWSAGPRRVKGRGPRDTYG
ncbi:MAG: DUF721 domain-containing protein [Candidatus Nanopelagicales bacterium]